MHERTQRAVARLLFVFCCAVPTALVFASILITWTSWYQSKKLAEVTYNLGRETGLAFEIDSCRRIAPGKYVLDNVQIEDPESGRLIATIRVVDYFHDQDHVAIVMHQAELQSVGLGSAWTKLHDRLLSSPAQTMLPITVAAADVNISSQTGSLPLPDLSVRITPEGKSIRMIALAGDPSNTIEPRVRVDLMRDRDGALPRTELVVSTEGTALPCSVMAEYSSTIRSLGPDAQFTGTIECVESADGWSFDLGSSTLSQINLSLLTQDLPHAVTGTAEIGFRGGVGGSTIRPGEIINLTGTLRAENVRLRPALLASIQRHLGMIIDENEMVPNPIGIECSLVALDFKITDAAMELTGICDRFRPGAGDNVALWARGRPIARTTSLQLESDRITTMLSPPSRWLSAWNQVLLPSAPAVNDPMSPAVEFRRAKNWSGGPTVQQPH